MKTTPKAVSAQALSGAFVSVLREWLTPAWFAEMQMRNSLQANPTICHSHDHCDANMAMVAAYCRLAELNEAEYELCADASSSTTYDALMALFDEAWKLAAPVIRQTPVDRAKSQRYVIQATVTVGLNFRGNLVTLRYTVDGSATLHDVVEALKIDNGAEHVDSIAIQTAEEWGDPLPLRLPMKGIPRDAGTDLLAVLTDALEYVNSDYMGRGGRDLTNGLIGRLEDAIAKASKP